MDMRFSIEEKTDIFFDLDHTLWDFERNSALAFEQVFQSNKVPFGIAAFIEYYTPINEAYWNKYSLNQISKETLRLGRLKDTFSKLNFFPDLDFVEYIAASYLQQLPENNHLFDGTVELLEYLKPRYRLHILTNGFKEVQAHKLKNSGLLQYFATITDSEGAGVKKPDPQIFNFALQQAKTKAHRAIMIGDNPIADIQGARNVGIDAIHFRSTDCTVREDIVQVDSLLEIRTFL